MSNKGKHTIESILQHINSSDRALERALVIILRNGTNKQIYNFDSNLVYFIAQIEKPRCLTPSQIAYARQKLAQVKYYGILRRCADEIMEENA